MRQTAQWLPLALLGASVRATPIGPVPITQLVYGTLGDSWASGVTYAAFGLTDYDKNKDGCMRLKDAYGPDMGKNLPSTQIAKHTFAACSGARMFDMAKGQNQLAKLDKNTLLVTMQAGGNDAGFYNIARDCIFHVDQSTDYGSPYGTGDGGVCAATIKAAEDYIMASPSASRGMYTDMHNTIVDVLDAQKSKFDLYVIGYAHFFNVDSPESDWCNDASFSVNLGELLNPNKKVKLSNVLRSKINDLTTKLNAQIAQVITDLKNEKVKYVSVTEGFKDHRFCEAGGSELSDRYGNDNTWFWNASPRGFFTGEGGASAQAQTNETDAYNAFKDEYQNSSPQSNFDWSDLLNFDKSWSEIIDPFKGPWQGASPGLALRPFHPTSAGHNSIKDSINAARI